MLSNFNDSSVTNTRAFELLFPVSLDSSSVFTDNFVHFLCSSEPKYRLKSRNYRCDHYKFSNECEKVQTRTDFQLLFHKIKD